MNSTFYIFGDFGDGYNQYPFDGTEVTYRRVASSSSRRKQYFIRREGERMYYGFMRRLDNTAGQYIGVCLLEQGVMIRDARPLMRLLEDCVENMAISDRLIGLDDGGNYEAHIGQLIEEREELDRVNHVFEQRLQNISYLWRSLPQVNFGTSVDDMHSISLESDPDEVAKACCNNGYLLLQNNEPVRKQSVTPSPGVDPSLLAAKEAAFREALARESTAIEATEREKAAKEAAQRELQSKEQALKETEKKLHALQKKQPSTAWRWIRAILLLSLLSVAGWWGYEQVMALIASRDGNAEMTATLHRTNRGLVQDVNDLQSLLREKESQYDALKNEMLLKDTIIDAMMDQYNIRQPLVPTQLFVTREAHDGYASATLGNNVSLKPGEQLMVHFRYVGLREGTAHVQLNITTPNNSWWFIAAPHIERRQVTVRPGSHIYDFSIWSPSNGYWDKGKYTIELIIDGEVAKSKTFNVN